MRVNRIEKDILGATRPPGGEWRKSRTEGVYGLIVGAAVAVFESTRLLRLHKPGMPEDWNVERIHEDLGAVGRVDGEMPWAVSPNFLVWSIGFFVNKAMMNVAAAIDRCTNAWLALSLGLNVDRGEADNVFFNVWIGARLAVLQGLVGSEEKDCAAGRVRELRFAFMRFGDSVRAAKDIAVLTERFRGGTLLRAYEAVIEERIRGSRLTAAAGVALLFARTNAFKHAILGIRKRGGVPQLMVECAIAARAVVYVAEFWKILLAATGHLDGGTKKPPQR